MTTFDGNLNPQSNSLVDNPNLLGRNANQSMKKAAFADLLLKQQKSAGKTKGDSNTQVLGSLIKIEGKDSERY